MSSPAVSGGRPTSRETWSDNPRYDPNNPGLLLIALRLLADTDRDEITWQDVTRHTAGRRIAVADVRHLLAHLAASKLITHRVAANKDRVGYGDLTKRIARRAGVRLMPTPRPEHVPAQDERLLPRR